MQIISRNNAVAWYQEIDENSVSVTYVANLLNSEISALTGPSEVIWLELNKPVKFESLVENIANHYSLEKNIVEADIKNFIGTLHAMNLIEIS